MDVTNETKRIPQIIISTTEIKWSSLRKEIQDRCAHEFEALAKNDEIKIYTQDENDFREVSAFLQNVGTPFHTYDMDS